MDLLSFLGTQVFVVNVPTGNKDEKEKEREREG